jgi:hypothetical protein
MTFDVTLTDNFHYRSQFVDTENITRRGKLPKLPINKDKIMIIKEMFHIPMKLKSELARASMTTSDVNNQWRSNFQQQII